MNELFENERFSARHLTRVVMSTLRTPKKIKKSLTLLGPSKPYLAYVDISEFFNFFFFLLSGHTLARTSSPRYAHNRRYGQSESGFSILRVPLCAPRGLREARACFAARLFRRRRHGLEREKLHPVDSTYRIITPSGRHNARTR